jgi:hypothetical protein
MTTQPYERMILNFPTFAPEQPQEFTPEIMAALFLAKEAMQSLAEMAATSALLVVKGKKEHFSTNDMEKLNLIFENTSREVKEYLVSMPLWAREVLSL